MRIKVLYLMTALILLQTIVVGCGKAENNKTEQVTVDKKETAETPKEKIKSNNIELAKDNFMVVNETVLDVFAKPDIQSERVTQAIFNQKVEVLEEQGKWTKVKVVDGYTGWVKPKYIEVDSSIQKAVESKFRVILTSKVKKVYAGSLNSTKLKDVVMGTELYSTNKADGKFQVLLPGGKSGWVDEEGTIRIPLGAQIPKTSAADFVTTAKKFMGTGYLWGGVSSMGIDCSGLTYISSRINGVNLPRDADKQYKLGEKITDLRSAISGDLLFFSTNEDLKDISHEGIYLGDKKFLHASKSKGSVIIGSMEDNYFKNRLVGIKRIF